MQLTNNKLLPLRRRFSRLAVSLLQFLALAGCKLSFPDMW